MYKHKNHDFKTAHQILEQWSNLLKKGFRPHDPVAQYLEKLIVAGKEGLNNLLAQGIVNLNEENPAQDQKQEQSQAPLSEETPSKEGAVDAAAEKKAALAALKREAKEQAKAYLESIGMDPALLDPPPPKPKPSKNQRSSLVVHKSGVKNHEKYEHGCNCPECKDGTLYDTNNPSIQREYDLKIQLIIRETAHQRLRCSTCGSYQTARNDNFSSDRLNPESQVSCAVLRSEGGMPFHRMSHVFDMMGIGLSKSLIFESCKIIADCFELVLPAMQREIANCPVLHVDDTGCKILEVSRREQDPNYIKGTLKEPSKRVTSRTSVILGCNLQGGVIGCVFIASERHCGENLAAILALRTEPSLPLLMADMSSCSDTPTFKHPPSIEGEKPYIRAGCNDHSLRYLSDAIAKGNRELEPLVSRYQKVYAFDATIKELDPNLRLEMHQNFSLPLMQEIYDLALGLLKEPDKQLRPEPRSQQGKALKYFVNHFIALIQFTQVVGAPLSNAASERAVKKPIMTRKSSGFFQTLEGARVTSLLNSATHTCHMLDCNPYDYLLALRTNVEQVKKNPECWTPLAYHMKQQSTQLSLKVS